MARRLIRDLLNTRNHFIGKHIDILPGKPVNNLFYAALSGSLFVSQTVNPTPSFNAYRIETVHGNVMGVGCFIIESNTGSVALDLNSTLSLIL